MMASSLTWRCSRSAWTRAPHHRPGRTPLAGVYNGSDFPFDLTDLRALDIEFANACLDYLNYDRLGKREVHHHLAGGDRELHQWFRDYGIEPALRLSERQEKAFAELQEKSGRDRYKLLDEAVDDLVDKYRRKTPRRSR